jgi:hypothetical protein
MTARKHFGIAQPRQIAFGDAFEAFLAPVMETRHQMPREAFQHLASVKGLEPDLVQRAQERPQSGLPGAQDHGPDHACKHEPFRHIVLRPGRPAEPSAAHQHAIDPDRVGPVEADRPLRRRMVGERIGERVHAGVESAAGRGQRFLGLQNHGELSHIGTPCPHKSARTRVAGNLAGVRESVADLAQSHEAIERRQVDFAIRDGSAQSHRWN